MIKYGVRPLIHNYWVSDDKVLSECAIHNYWVSDAKAWSECPNPKLLGE